MNADHVMALPHGAMEIPLRSDQPAPVPGRVAAMFEVRESDYDDKLLFTAMLEQTYEPYRDNPWVAAVLATKMAAMHASYSHTFVVNFDDGTTLQLEVLIERIKKPHATVVRFQLGPFVHVWSMSSAATTNAGGDNDFTQILLAEIRRAKSQLLIAANISRLVRSDQEAGLLLKVLPDHVDAISTGSQVMKLNGENSEYGRMQFMLLGSMAAMERTWIVTRMMTGRIAAWRRGQWLYGRNSVPFGYRLDEENRLHPIPEMREQVREMLLILGTDQAPALTALQSCGGRSSPPATRSMRSR